MSAIVMQIIATIMLVGFIVLINVAFITAIVFAIKAINKDKE